MKRKEFDIEIEGFKISCLIGGESFSFFQMTCPSGKVVIYEKKKSICTVIAEECANNH